MTEWKKVKLGDVCSRLSSGKSISAKEIFEQGSFPVYGGNGIRGYSEKYNFDGECAIIGRQGAFCGNVRFFSGKGYMTEHAVVVCANNDNCTRFLSYYLSTMHLGRLSAQSAQPGLAVGTLAVQELNVPPLPTQKKIAEVLSCLDAKIELNRRINENLEQQAGAIFKEWFVDNAKPEWKVGKLEDYVTIKRGGSPRPIQNYLTETGLRWLKISDVTSLNTPFIFNIAEHIKEEGLNKTVFLKAGSLVLSNSATPGIPKILAVDSCIHDGWLYFTDSKFSNEFLYLLFQHARPDFLSKGNGSIFINLKTDIVKAYQFPIPDDESLEKFQSIVGTLFGKMYQVTAENLKLAEIRDALLPKLMSGELEV